ncbi:MAG: hypothetical protein V4617_18550 [Gemmatimonadota bacterium]
MLTATRGRAQGCEPIRFTSPVNLGGEGQMYQSGGEWQFTLAYRHLLSKDWFVGTRENSSLAPGGSSPVFDIHTMVADVAYAVNDRLRVRVSVPVSTGTLARTWPDKVHHVQRARGIGDVSAMGELWLLSPRAHELGNVSIGVGVKAPTGSHTIASQFHTASGAVDFPADQTIQPGDGGWAVLLQAQGFRQLREGMFAYANGSYMVSPKARSNVQWTPGSGQYWAVPDVYSARAGAAVSVLPEQGLTASLGARVDGIPVRDLIGGGDAETIKRSAYVIFADPGMSLSRGKGTFTLSVPYRLKVNRQKSMLEQRTGALNAGGFAKYLVFASYSHRI